MDRNPDQFVTFLKQRAGQSLRSVRVYSGTDHRSLYTRTDVQQRTPETDIDQIVRQARRESQERAETEMQFSKGELEGTVRIFHEVVIVNLLTSGDYGVLVSLDAEIASRLHSFIHDCQSWLDDD